MPNTIVVGDSVGLGISKAITGSTFAGAEGLRIDQMAAHFNSAFDATGQGDTVIISAGYNSTGANGISTADLKTLQTAVDTFVAKGAKVVIVPLRESGMSGDYARLNGQTSKTNEQLRTLKGATMAEAGIATANGIADGGIHGNYAKLASVSQDAASKITAGAVGSVSDGEKQAAAADSKGSGFDLSGIWDTIKGIFSMLIEGIMSAVSGIVDWFKGGKDKVAANDNSAPAAGESKAQDQGKAAPDAKAQAEALAAAKGNSAAGTGKEVADSSTPSLPEAKGPRVKAVG